MSAIGVERFVVTLVDAKQGKQEVRRWHKTEVIKSMQWLGRMNARGYDVWIRPDGEHGVVLLCGLKKSDLRTLHERGFAPAAVVETGREQFQAWVKLSDQPLREQLRGQAAERLVNGLGRAGANSVSRTDGRLAGFTNQQVLRDGVRHPFVLVSESGGKVAPAASTYLTRLQQAQEKAQQLMHEKQRSRQRGFER